MISIKENNMVLDKRKSGTSFGGLCKTWQGLEFILQSKSRIC